MTVFKIINKEYFLIFKPYTVGLIEFQSNSRGVSDLMVEKCSYKNTECKNVMCEILGCADFVGG